MTGSGDAPKVALLAIDYPPSIGGAQKYLEGLVSLLADWPVRVFAPGTSSDGQAQLVTRLGSGGTGPAARAIVNARMIGAVLRWRPDVVIAGHVLALPAAVATGLCVRAGVLAVVYGSELRSPRFGRMIRPLLRRADRVVAISNFTADEAVRIGVRREQLVLVPPAVNVPRSGGAGIPERLQQITKPYLLTLGRLDDLHKGQDTAIHAMSELCRHHPTLTLVVAGDGRERGALEALAKQLDVAEQVRFVGRVSDDEKESLMAHAEALLLLSRMDDRGRFEGFGIVVLEAGALGVPAVVSGIGGLPDTVEHERTGLVVDAGDAAEVARIIDRILQAGEPARLGEAARERVFRGFLWQTRAEQVKSLVAEVAGKRG